MNRNKNVQRLSVFIMILALTILACQGAGGFNPFATATPTPTATFTPSPTPSPTLTFTPTATPHPTGKLKEEQPDGTTLFRDLDGSYQVTFPQGWTVTLLDQDDIKQILERFPKQEKDISKMIESVKKADVNSVIQVVGFNFKAQQGGYTPNINIAYDTNPISHALSVKDLVDATVAYYPSLNIKVIHSEIKKTSSGIEIGVIETQWTLNAPSGQKVNLRQKQVLFKSGEGTVITTFATLQDAKIDLSDDIEKLIESIQLLNL